MDIVKLFLPAIVLTTYVLGALVVFGIMWSAGVRPTVPQRTHSSFFHFFMNFFVWLIGPIERVMLHFRVSPNSVTVASFLVCVGAGLAIATGHLATAGWLYISAGGLDILDGRLARATGDQTEAGAFLDSVSDRWGEIFVFAGFAWFLRDTAWLLAVMLAQGASLMVSYTRARGEGLGVRLDRGHMQRPERITIVSIAILVTAWFDAVSSTYSRDVIGVALLIVGLGSTITAVGRYYRGYRTLKPRAAGDEEQSHPVDL